MAFFLLFLVFAAMILYMVKLSGRVSHLEQWARANSKKSSPGAANAGASTTNSRPGASVSLGQAKASMMQAKSRPAPPAPLSSQPVDSKTFINALPKIGVVALVLGILFFFKYAIDQGWISVELRLLMGGGLGLLLMLLYYLWHEKYQKYALALGGGGMVLLHLTVFVAFSLYHIISTNTALMLMVLITILGLALAYLTTSKVLGAIAWCGGYLVPMLIGLYNSNYILTLVYLTLLNIGVAFDAWRSNQLYPFVIGLVGTVLNLIVYAMDGSGRNFTGETAIFLSLNFALMSSSITAMIKLFVTGTNSIDVINEYAVMLGAVAVALVTPLAVIAFNDYREFAPLILLALSVWVFVLYAFIDRLEYELINYVNSTIGAVLLTLAVFWQFGDKAEIIMAYVLGLFGLVIGRVQKRLELRVLALGVVIVGLVAAFMYQYLPTDNAFLMNTKFGLEFLGLIALGVAYGIYSTMEHDEFEADVLSGLQYLITVMFGIFVTWDIIQYFAGSQDMNQRNLLISLWWLAYGVVLMLLSFVHQFKPMRKIALGLLGLVILKVFLYDASSLDTVYRIISFISLGVILLIISFFYQKNKDKIKQYLDA